MLHAVMTLIRPRAVTAVAMWIAGATILSTGVSNPVFVTLTHPSIHVPTSICHARHTVPNARPITPIADRMTMPSKDRTLISNPPLLANTVPIHVELRMQNTAETVGVIWSNTAGAFWVAEAAILRAVLSSEVFITDADWAVE
jgi:hypothetical protein